MTYNISEVKRHFVISGTSLYPFRYKRSLYDVIDGIDFGINRRLSYNESLLYVHN